MTSKKLVMTVNSSEFCPLAVSLYVNDSESQLVVTVVERLTRSLGVSSPLCGIITISIKHVYHYIYLTQLYYLLL